MCSPPARVPPPAQTSRVPPPARVPPPRLSSRVPCRGGRPLHPCRQGAPVRSRVPPAACPGPARVPFLLPGSLPLVAHTCQGDWNKSSVHGRPVPCCQGDACSKRRPGCPALCGINVPGCRRHPGRARQAKRTSPQPPAPGHPGRFVRTPRHPTHHQTSPSASLVAEGGASALFGLLLQSLRGAPTQSFF